MWSPDNFKCYDTTYIVVGPIPKDKEFHLSNRKTDCYSVTFMFTPVTVACILQCTCVEVITDIKNI